MSQTLMTVVLFVALLACVPLAIKWVQRRSAGGVTGVSSAPRVISAVAVGPHQRVVSVEVGPENARIWLILGVTAQSITCLHSVPIGSAATSTVPVVLESSLL